jgi:hypothetical protein
VHRACGYHRDAIAVAFGLREQLCEPLLARPLELRDQLCRTLEAFSLVIGSHRRLPQRGKHASRL